MRVNALSVSYEVVGDEGGRPPWVITPGGRFSKDSPGVRELAVALAKRGNRVLIWDRPNCGASDVCFTGASESAMQADVLAELLRELGQAPAVIVGGSGGARVSLLTAARHRDVASGLAMWWISGGVFGLMVLGVHYCSGSLKRTRRSASRLVQPARLLGSTVLVGEGADGGGGMGDNVLTVTTCNKQDRHIGHCV